MHGEILVGRERYTVECRGELVEQDAVAPAPGPAVARVLIPTGADVRERVLAHDPSGRLRWFG